MSLDGLLHNTDRLSKNIAMYDKQMHQKVPKSHEMLPGHSHPYDLITLVAIFKSVLLQIQLFSC